MASHATGDEKYRFRRDRFQAFLELPKTLVKHPKVRFLSSPLQNPGFPRVFRISGQVLWLSVAPMLAQCMADRGVVFRVAHRKSSRFSSRASRQITGVLHVTVWPRSTPVEAVGFEQFE